MLCYEYKRKIFIFCILLNFVGFNFGGLLLRQEFIKTRKAQRFAGFLFYFLSTAHHVAHHFARAEFFERESSEHKLLLFVLVQRLEMALVNQMRLIVSHVVLGFSPWRNNSWTAP